MPEAIAETCNRLYQAGVIAKLFSNTSHDDIDHVAAHIILVPPNIAQERFPR
jgi:hypothetical protein